MNVIIGQAEAGDADQLLALYSSIYGPNYPLAFATDRSVMLKTIRSEEFFLWLVARDTGQKRIVGSIVYDIDPLGKIGKITGLVVDPEYRKQHLASRLVAEGTRRLLSPSGVINSLYATTRTNSIGIQLIFLRDDFLPLGIFPNAHKLQGYETLTLFAKFKPGVLDRRMPVVAVPEELGGLLAIQEKLCGIRNSAAPVPPAEKGLNPQPQLEFEFILAPEYVRREFNEKMSDPYDRFYPFHVPNLLLSAKNGEVDLFAYFNGKDRYCAIVALTAPIHRLSGRMTGLLHQLKDIGVSYLEVLLGLQYRQSIEAALAEGFVPSAIYPAMREVDGRMYDFVILSRTMEPLNFQGIAIERSFKPYIDEYVRLWSKKHLQSLEVYDAT